MGRIEYSSNNSGGSFWLSDANWHALEAAGWIVHWNHDLDDASHEHASEYDPKWDRHNHAYGDDVLIPSKPSSYRFLDALATSAAKVTDDPAEAVAEFERVTGSNADDKGCGCCGTPHSFTFYDDEGTYKSFSSRPAGYERNWD